MSTLEGHELDTSGSPSASSSLKWLPIVLVILLTVIAEVVIGFFALYIGWLSTSAGGGVDSAQRTTASAWLVFAFLALPVVSFIIVVITWKRFDAPSRDVGLRSI